jgi:hypothetical protein
MLRATVVLFLLTVSLSAWAGEGDVTPSNVKQATSQAVNYLYSIANPKGVWDKEPAPPGMTGGKEVGDTDSQWCGRTSLVLAALALAGEEKDPRFQTALKWLMAQQARGTYAVALRLVLLRNLARSADYPAVLKRDAAYLQSGGRVRGNTLMWSYMPPPATPEYVCMGDYSNVNYAVLGLWAATDLRFEVQQRVWLGLERTWTQGQLPNGAWAYFPAKEFTPKMAEEQRAPRGSMTAAAIASLYVIIDQCYAASGKMGAYRDSDAYKSIQAGLKWLAENFDAKANPGRAQFASYYFYNCERVAAAAGLKYFGEHDWFREIGRTILGQQAANGSIVSGEPENMGGALVDTAFALMFLTRGSSPIIVNKLQHAGDWDNHPRDVAAVTEWYARQSERPATWQAVSLKGPAEDLTDSRILFLAGTQALAFTDEERAKLKRYVDLGGLLVFHPDANEGPFRDSVKKLLGDLWPKLELTAVDPATHPLTTFYNPLKGQPVIKQLASPTRVYAFVLEGAPSEAWEKREYATQEDAFNIAANLHRYATDLEPPEKLPTKLTFFAELFRPRTPETNRSIPLALIRYGPLDHRWNPEPLAFERFARRLAAEKKINCDLKVVAPGDLAGCGAKIAHLTGIDAVDLTKPEQDAIRAFLKAGGTLLIDQAGGPPAHGKKETFDAAIRKMIYSWYGLGSLLPVPKEHPLFADLETLEYHNVDGKRRQKMPLALEQVVQDGRSVIYYSRYDLTCGLLECPNPLLAGPDGDGCFEILQRILTAPPPEPPK